MGRIARKSAQTQCDVWRAVRGLALLLFIGGAVVFSPTVFAHSQAPGLSGEGLCTKMYGFHLPNLLPMQGIAGPFILKNDCTQEVSGILLLRAAITNCRYSGPFGNTATRKLTYTLGPDAEHLYTLSIEASCIKCHCLITDPERAAGFNLSVSVYDMEGEGDPVEYRLYDGPDPGGGLQVGSCGAGIGIEYFNARVLPPPGGSR